MIVAAYAGTGKTTLANKYPQTVTDFICMPYKYCFDGQNEYVGEPEACKANPDNVMHYDWPHNYVSALKAAESEDHKKIWLIPTDTLVLWLLEQENLQYALCYPERSAKEVYQQRFINRGNTTRFLHIFIGNWDCYFDRLEKYTYGRHIVMKSHEFLTDIYPLFTHGCLNGESD